MNYNKHIAPSLLAVEPQTIDAIISTTNVLSAAEYLHIDVMDGKFVPQKTVFDDPDITRQLHQHLMAEFNLPVLDVHLMVENPKDYINPFVMAGADMITFHIEATDKPDELIKEIKQKYHRCVSRLRAGVALNPNTPVSEVTSLLKDLDYVLVMSVEPGKCGQQFDEKSLQKLNELRTAIYEQDLKSSVTLGIDGGIKKHNLHKVANAGADIIVSGSGIISQKEPAAMYQEMYNLINDPIVVGCDHAGYDLKQKIMKRLDELGHVYADVGTYSKESCDYPVIAAKLSQRIDMGYNSIGVLVCGSGVGMTVVANRFPGVSAVLAWNEETAKQAREHGNANVFCAGDKYMDHGTVLAALDTFLNTKPLETERYVNRQRMVKAINPAKNYL